MSRLMNVAEQKVLTNGFFFNGVTTAAPKVILPNAAPRSGLWLANSSDTQMYFEMGSARAHATIASGVVTSVTVDNAGFNFTIAPRVYFCGGSNHQNGLFIGCAYPSQEAPSRPAQAHCVMTSDGYGGGKFKVSSIVVDDGGAGYALAPYVLLMNDPNDPYGCADPSVGSGSGWLAYPGYSWDEGSHNVCPTDSVAVWAAASATGKAYLCRITT